MGDARGHIHPVGMNRSWCGVIQYPDREPVCFGTTLMRPDATDHEVEAALRRDINLCLPAGWRLINMIPGAIFFVPEESDDAG